MHHSRVHAAYTPFFFLLMAVHGVVGLGRRSIGGRWAYADAQSSLAAGIMQQFFVLLVLVPLGINTFYRRVWDAYGYHDVLPLGTWYSFPVAFVTLDFFYYWFHRHAHEVHLLWTGHAVHHSSEHYNLVGPLSLRALLSWNKFQPDMGINSHAGELELSRRGRRWSRWCCSRS